MSVTDSELNRIRGNQSDFLPQRVILRKRAFVGDGGFSPENVAINVPARLMPGLGRWSELAERYEGITPYRLTVPWDQELLAGWVVVDENGQTYEVRDVMSGSSYQTATQALVDRITGG